MTDREAIRMLAKAVLTLSRLVPHTSVEGLAKTVLEELPMPAAPTVTREQAEWVSDVIQTKWYDMRAKQDDEREAPPVRYEMPAFFRAVADRLLFP